MSLTDRLKYSQHRDDPADFHGFNNDQFNAYMEQIAYTSPADYLKIKHKLYRLLIKGLMTDLNDLIYNALTEGTVNGETMFDAKFMASLSQGGKAIVSDMRETLGGDGFKPSYPRKKTNDITLSIVESMKENIKIHVVDNIMKVDRNNDILGHARRQADINLGGDSL